MENVMLTRDVAHGLIVPAVDIYPQETTGVFAYRVSDDRICPEVVSVSQNVKRYEDGINIETVRNSLVAMRDMGYDGLGGFHSHTPRIKTGIRKRLELSPYDDGNGGDIDYINEWMRPLIRELGIGNGSWMEFVIWIEAHRRKRPAGESFRFREYPYKLGATWRPTPKTSFNIVLSAWEVSEEEIYEWPILLED